MINLSKNLKYNNGVMTFHFTQNLLEGFASAKIIEKYEHFYTMYYKNTFKNDIKSLEEALGCEINFRESFFYAEVRKRLIPEIIKRIKDVGFNIIYVSNKWFTIVAKENDRNKLASIISDTIEELISTVDFNENKNFASLKYYFTINDVPSTIKIKLFLNKLDVSVSNKGNVFNEDIKLKNIVNRLSGLKVNYDKRVGETPELLIVNSLKLHKNYFNRIKMAIELGILSEGEFQEDEEC